MQDYDSLGAHIADHMVYLNKKIKSRYQLQFEQLQKDEVIYLEFLKDLSGMEFPLDKENVERLRIKYWSHSGFSFFSAMINMAMASLIARYPSLWVEDFTLNEGSKKALLTDASFFQHEMVTLFTLARGPDDNHSRDTFELLLEYSEKTQEKVLSSISKSKREKF
jgi:hypothetical protein